MKLYILIIMLLVLLSSCSSVRDEICSTIDVWEEQDSKGKNHIMVRQVCMDTKDFN